MLIIQFLVRNKNTKQYMFTCMYDFNLVGKKYVHLEKGKKYAKRFALVTSGWWDYVILVVFITYFWIFYSDLLYLHYDKYIINGKIRK